MPTHDTMVDSHGVLLIAEPRPQVVGREIATLLQTLPVGQNPLARLGAGRLPEKDRTKRARVRLSADETSTGYFHLSTPFSPPRGS